MLEDKYEIVRNGKLANRTLPRQDPSSKPHLYTDTKGLHETPNRQKVSKIKQNS